jgi:hypothetical protein
MQSSKLHQLLATLSVYELNRFYKYIQSPYHCEDQRLIQLYTYLLPHYKTDKPQPPDRATIWQHIHPTRPLTNLHFARLLSDLLQQLEGFVALERMRARPAQESYYLLDVYTGMGLPRHFTEPYLDAVTQLDRQPYRDSDYYYHRFRLNEQQHIYLENRQQRNTEKNLLETVHSLDTYYLINKLRYSAATLHYKHFLNLRDETILLDAIMAHLRLQPPHDLPVVDLYYHVVLTLIEPDEPQHFAQLKLLLFTHDALLEREAQREVFAFALNYCIRKINKGQAAYQRELFDLYRDALARGLMLDKGVLTPWDFKNITTIALRNKELTWAEGFIEQYQHQLPKAERANAYTFNRARYHFAAREYDRVLELLQSVEYSDVFYLLDSKTTLMKTYYELGEPLPLQSLKESFRILLRRKKLISEQNRVNYDNFARFTMKLFRADVRNKKQVAALRLEIAATPNMADRSWILEKLDEISPP